ncbi:MAG: hypothetical protein AAB783_01480 [Patescibacteria group bacterium]
MKEKINYFLYVLGTVVVGVFVFTALTYAKGFKAEPVIPFSVAERPIGDSFVYSLLLISSSDELGDIEKDLQSTELRGLDSDLAAAEDVFRQ